MRTAALVLWSASVAAAAEPKQPLKAKSIVFVMDCGGSSERFGVSFRAQLGKWIGLMEGGQATDFVNYREHATTVFGKLTPAGDLAKQKAAQGV